MSTPLELLRHHVTGAIERGEAQPIVAIEVPEMPDWLTSKQRDAYIGLHARWDGRVEKPIAMIGGDGCAMVECRYESGGSIWMGIETDGYTHS